MSYRKTYVKVMAVFDEDGAMQPASMIWDGRVIEVDRVLDVTRAASLKAGGCGVRYRCRILGKPRNLWYEDGRWFVEERTR